LSLLPSSISNMLYLMRRD